MDTIKCLQIADEKLNRNAILVLILICLFLSSFMTVHAKNESQTPFLTRALIAERYANVVMTYQMLLLQNILQDSH